MVHLRKAISFLLMAFLAIANVHCAAEIVATGDHAPHCCAGHDEDDQHEEAPLKTECDLCAKLPTPSPMPQLPPPQLTELFDLADFLLSLQAAAESEDDASRATGPPRDESPPPHLGWLRAAHPVREPSSN